MKRLPLLLLGITGLVLATSGCVTTTPEVDLAKQFNKGMLQFEHVFMMDALPYAPDRKKKPPVMIYAHGGGGFVGSSGARVRIFKQEGFATVAFDAFKLHGLDGEYVNTRYSNSGKQDMIIPIMKVAYDYVLRQSDWDTERIFLYGASNGGRMVLCIPSLVKEPFRIRGILSEAPASTGCSLPDDLDIPTRILYGEEDDWGNSPNVPTLSFERENPSMPTWVKSLRKKGRDIELIFYEEAGHSFHSGKLHTKKRCFPSGRCSTGNLGASSKAVKLYERDVKVFIDAYSK